MSQHHAKQPVGSERRSPRTSEGLMPIPRYKLMLHSQKLVDLMPGDERFAAQLRAIQRKAR